MDNMNNHKINGNGLNGLRPSTVTSVVALAISGSKNSKYVIRWAFTNMIPEGGPEKVCFKLIHVFPAIRSVPMPCKLRELRNSIYAVLERILNS